MCPLVDVQTWAGLEPCICAYAQAFPCAKSVTAHTNGRIEEVVGQWLQYRRPDVTPLLCHEFSVVVINLLNLILP